MKTCLILCLLFVLLLIAACAPSPGVPPVPATEPALAAQDGWLTYTNPAGFTIRYPYTWSEAELPQQAGDTYQTAVVQGAEGEVDLHWGAGFGGACPQGYTTVTVAEGELPACYVKNPDGTEAWTQINKELSTTSFSAEARTLNSDPASHDLVLEVLSTLSFASSGTTLAGPEQGATQLTARMLTAPNALAGPSPSSFNWSPVGASLAYVEPQDDQDVLWLYNAVTGDKEVLLDPAKSPGNIDVTSAQWSPQGDKLLLAGDEALWLLDLATGDLSSLGEGGSAITSMMFTPDGKRVSYVQDNDLYLAGIDDGQVQRLTTDGGETVFNGALDWVYNEELAARAAQPAYAWSPDGNWLIYLRLDDSEVNNDPVTDYRPVPATVSYTRYPAAGTANPVASLHALTPGALAPPLEVPLPDDAEYVLPFFTWTPDSNHALYITVNRDHTELSLIMWTPQSGEMQTLITEEDPYWINEDRYSAPVFLADGEQFLWASERGGFLHLYLYKQDGTLVKQLTEGDWMIDASAWDLLTAGRPVHVDPSGTTAYFITTQVSPLERHIYRLDLANGELEQLTQEPGFHLFALSGDGQYLVDQFSDVDTPPITKIVKTGDGSATVLSEAAGPALDLPDVTREFVTVKAYDGTDLYAQLVKPENFDPTKQYPVVVHWYGGPGLQMVSNRYGTTNIFNIIERDVLYTQEGMLVWRLDNRGSFGRGHAFETPIFGELGKAALDDQLAGIEYLKTLPYVDATRIGTDGKSFGGYMTLYALLHAPDVFGCGVAGAAPTDWSYYDTIYTERYMRTPDKNPEGYAATNLIDLAGQIQARPLLIHGLDDTNVHLQNTVNFIQALEANDKLFDFIPLPNLSHSFQGDGLVAALSASADYLAACLTGAASGAQQPAAPAPAAEPVTSTIPSTATTAPIAGASTEGTTLQPLSPEECNELARAMGETLGTQVTQGDVPITDPSTGASGMGCETKATGTGEQFSSPDAVVNELAAMLEAQGWQEDPMLASGGPTGFGEGFRKDDQMCMAVAQWWPDASVNCPQDQPISACEVTPAQQAYTVTLDCAQSTTEATSTPTAAAPPQGWQTYANPLGFSISYPATWTAQQLPAQGDNTLFTEALQGSEGEVELQWGMGFGGACPQGYTTVQVAQGELPTCYTKNADGTESWTQINKKLELTGFSANARTGNADPASHDLVLEVLSTLGFPPIAAITATQVITYSPGPPTGAPQEGSCWTNSLAVWRADAWRCMVGNAIYDPCFSQDDSVICGADPVTPTVSFALTLTEPLPAAEVPPDAATHAWLVELPDGTVCGYATGATGGVGDVRINYMCPSSNPDQQVVILGDLQPGQVWMASYAVLTGEAPDLTVVESVMVPIRTIWK